MPAALRLRNARSGTACLLSVFCQRTNLLSAMLNALISVTRGDHTVSIFPDEQGGYVDLTHTGSAEG